MNVEFFLLKTVSTKMPPDFRPRDGMAQPEPLCGPMVDAQKPELRTCGAFPEPGAQDSGLLLVLAGGGLPLERRRPSSVLY